MLRDQPFVAARSGLYTLIGGTAAGTLLTVVFLPALYSAWFRVKPSSANERT